MANLLGTFGRDARYALRLLRRSPAFAATAVATLALGIGGATAIFTIVDAVLLRPLRFREPQQLTMIRLVPDGSPGQYARVTAAYLLEWRRRSPAFADVAGWEDVRVNLTGEGEPVELLADRATANFFSVLGTPAALGRTFTARADLGAVEPEVVLSHGLWQRRYGGRPDVVGRSMMLDGHAFTIVGVMPTGFGVRTNELAESHAELWMPLPLAANATTGGGYLSVVARLASTVSVAQGQAALALATRQIDAENPPNTRWIVDVTSLQSATVNDVRLTLLVLFGAVSILLLIACVNVANLVLSRIASRQTELATRLSLGASSGRLFRQLVTESLVLTLIGGTLGIALAAGGTHLFAAMLPAGLPLPRTGEIEVNLRILLFATLVTTGTAMFVGLIPWLNARRSATQAALRGIGSGSQFGRDLHGRLGSGLVIAEIALAFVLLVGAGLVIRSFRGLIRVDPGFRTEQVLTMRLTLPADRYESLGRIRAFSREFLQRVQGLPGVRAVGFANYLPMSNIGIGGSFTIEGRPLLGGDRPRSWISVVGGDYFAAMGIPLVRGRLFAAADTELTTPVFVIDEELARRYWPDEDPIGKRVTWQWARGVSDGGETPASGPIVGVVGGVRWGGMAGNRVPTTYFWFPQDPRPQLAVTVRAVGDATPLASAIAAELHRMDPNQPLADVRAMADHVTDDLAQPRVTMQLLGAFGIVALLLAAIGVYGVIAFAVARRTREIGVRVALGAERRDVLLLVMRRGLLLTGLGIAVGIAAALTLSRTMTGLVFGIVAGDPMTFAAASFFLGAVALAAMYIPARRATRVNPLIALKTQ